MSSFSGRLGNLSAQSRKSSKWFVFWDLLREYKFMVCFKHCKVPWGWSNFCQAVWSVVTCPTHRPQTIVTSQRQGDASGKFPSKGLPLKQPPNYVFWKVRSFDIPWMTKMFGKINWCAKVPDMICVLEWVPFSHFRLGFVLKVCQFSSLHQSFKKDSHPECLVMSRERCCTWELSGRWWPVYWLLEVCPSVGVNFLPINL